MSPKRIVEPTHTLFAPVIAAGARLTVTTVDTSQPAGVRYVIVAVPGTNPLTTPDDEPIVAIVVAELLQVPPVVASDIVTGVPVQIVVDPAISGTAVLIATEVVFAVVPQPVELNAVKVYIPAAAGLAVSVGLINVEVNEPGPAHE